MKVGGNFLCTVVAWRVCAHFPDCHVPAGFYTFFRYGYRCSSHNLFRNPSFFKASLVLGLFLPCFYFSFVTLISIKSVDTPFLRRQPPWSTIFFFFFLLALWERMSLIPEERSHIEVSPAVLQQPIPHHDTCLVGDFSYRRCSI